MEPEESHALEAHIAKCAACAARIAEERNLDATLRTALVGVDPDTARLEQTLRREMAHHRRRHAQAWAGAIAATVVVLAGAGLMWARWTMPPKWYTDAAIDHRAEVIDHQPRRWRSGDTELAGLMEQNGLQLGQVTALAAPGYRLERAKVCGIAGARMLHLVFSDGTRTYSVFVSPHPGPVEAVRTIRQGAEQIAGFETGHFRGVVVWDGSAAECTELAHAAERRL
jgi:hypothetical protein